MIIYNYLSKLVLFLSRKIDKMAYLGPDFVLVDSVGFIFERRQHGASDPRYQIILTRHDKLKNLPDAFETTMA